MNKIVSLGIILTLSAAIAGCDQKTNNEVKPESSSQPSEVVSPAPKAENITIKHASGETTVMKNPQRIVVLDFGTLDTLDQLDLGDNVVALPKSNVPDYLEQYKDEKYANTGNMKEPDIETISQSNPDLIIITGRQNKSYEQLSGIAPTINLSVDNKNYQDSFKHNANIIGELFDKQATIKQEIDRLDKEIAEYRAKTEASDLKALVIMHNANKLGSANTSGYATIIHDIAGLKRADINLEAKRQAIDEPYLSAVNPDIIFIIDRSAAIGQDKLDSALLETDAFKNTNASKNDKIIYLTPSLWYLSGGGLESLTLQLDEVIDALD